MVRMCRSETISQIEIPKMLHLSKAEHELLYLQQPDMPENPHILKISVLGVPNAGKSTLVNRLMNRRVI